MTKKDSGRILIKLSGEALMGKTSYGIEINTVDRIAKNIEDFSKKKLQICIVIGGGNIFRGLAASSKGMERANADYMGMLATVLNSLALQHALEKIDVEISAPITTLRASRFSAFLKFLKPQLNFFHKWVHRCLKITYILLKFFSGM